MDLRPLTDPLTPTLPLQIAERIGGAIVDETLRPGERLKEVNLAATFRVSRATLREALRILENRGLVSIVPQRGAQVTQLSRTELEELFEIRAVLLGLVSRRVALSCTPEVERAIFAGLRTLQGARHDATAYAHASAEMVAVLARACGNRQLLDYMTSFAHRIGRYARLGLSTPTRRRQSLGNWQKLVSALVARDGDAAESLHRRLSMQNLAAGLAELDRRARVERGDERRPTARRRH